MSPEVKKICKALKVAMVAEISTRKLGVARFEGKFFFTIESLIEVREPEKFAILNGYPIDRIENLVFWYILWDELIKKTIKNVIAEGGTHAIE